MPVLDRVERACRDETDERSLRAAVLAELRRTVGFDAYAWLLTDPVTLVGWGPVADVPRLDELPALVRARYRTTVNRWTDLSPGVARTIGASITSAPAGVVDDWLGLLARHGVDDVLTVVCGDRFGRWAFLDLWRLDGLFSAEERATAGAVADRVAPALRHRLAATFTGPAPAGPSADGPAVLLLADDLASITQTPATEGYLRRLLPTEADRAPVPAAAYNVTAQLLAREAGVDDHPPWARMHLDGASWVTVRAGRLVEPAPDGATVAVSVEPCPPGDRLALFARTTGLSARETDVLEQVALGHANREIARRLFVSEHTVQDHLKAVFEKAGTNDRRTLVARATGAVEPG